MVQNTDHGEDGLMLAFRSLSWLVFAAAVAVAAGWGAYYKLGGFDTPIQKAGVVGAALVGLGVAVWVNTIARVVIWGLVILLLIWGGNYYWQHYHH